MLELSAASLGIVTGGTTAPPGGYVNVGKVTVTRQDAEAEYWQCEDFSSIPGINNILGQFGMSTENFAYIVGGLAAAGGTAVFGMATGGSSLVATSAIWAGGMSIAISIQDTIGGEEGLVWDSELECFVPPDWYRPYEDNDDGENTTEEYETF